MKLQYCVASIACALAFSSSASAYDVKANGFGSMYYGQSLQREVQPFGFADSHADFQHFSSVGADVNVNIDKEWSAAAEIMASGEPGPTTNYNSFVQWAFVNYKPMDNVSIKLGRQRYPLFTASEYINTHHELPYRAIPSLVYRLMPFSTFDGASANYGFDVGFGKLNIGVFGGSPVLDLAIPGSTTSFADMVGARINLEGEGWRIRVQASRYSSELSLPGLGSGYFQDTAEVYSVGYRFDKWDIVSWGEYAFENARSGDDVVPAIPAGVVPNSPAGLPGGKFFDKAAGGYVLLGYRIGNWMPRYTYANAMEKASFADGTVQMHNIGFNYKFNEWITAKVDYEWYKMADPNRPVVIKVLYPTTKQETSAVYAGIDFYF